MTISIVQEKSIVDSYQIVKNRITYLHFLKYALAIACLKRFSLFHTDKKTVKMGALHGHNHE